MASNTSTAHQIVEQQHQENPVRHVPLTQHTTLAGMVNTPTMLSFLHSLGNRNDGNAWDFTRRRKRKNSSRSRSGGSSKKKRRGKKEKTSIKKKKERCPVTDFLAKDSSQVKPAGSTQNAAEEKAKATKTKDQERHSIPLPSAGIACVEEPSAVEHCSCNSCSSDWYWTNASSAEEPIVHQPPVPTPTVTRGFVDHYSYYQLPYCSVPEPEIGAMTTYRLPIADVNQIRLDMPPSPLPISPTTQDMMRLSPASSLEFFPEMADHQLVRSEQDHLPFFQLSSVEEQDDTSLLLSDCWL
jgi:hypothetical protein